MTGTKSASWIGDASANKRYEGGLVFGYAFIDITRTVSLFQSENDTEMTLSGMMLCIKLNC
jgi:hypothetical protein